MLQESFLRVYEKLKSEFCRQVFALVRERRGSLSAMEAFSLEIIRQLGRPTVSQFAAFLNISQSNATYKVASLVRKGYLLKENSGADRREYYLVLTPKYYGYVGTLERELCEAVRRFESRHGAQETERFAALLDELAADIGAGAGNSTQIGE